MKFHISKTHIKRRKFYHTPYFNITLLCTLFIVQFLLQHVCTLAAQIWLCASQILLNHVLRIPHSTYPHFILLIFPKNGHIPTPATHCILNPRLPFTLLIHSVSLQPHLGTNQPLFNDHLTSRPGVAGVWIRVAAEPTCEAVVTWHK